MSGVMLIAEHRRGAVRDITFELASLGAELKAQGAGAVTMVVIAEDPRALLGDLATDPVDEIVCVASPKPEFDAQVSDRVVSALVEQRSPAVVLVGHTVDGSGFAPAVAARGGLGFASNVICARFDDGALTARRGAYGDRLVATLQFGDAPVVLMVRPGMYPPAARSRLGDEVSDVSVTAPEQLVQHLGFREADTGGLDITQSQFLLSIGRGVGEEENVERFATLAEGLGATLTASRPLVDAGWLPSARQVGQSGRTVKPKVYLALGISGAVQHLAGIRDAETVIAVNTDPDAPIFGAAQYGAVLDIHDLADALEVVR